LILKRCIAAVQRHICRVCWFGWFGLSHVRARVAPRLPALVELAGRGAAWPRVGVVLAAVLELAVLDGLAGRGAAWPPGSAWSWSASPRSAPRARRAGRRGRRVGVAAAVSRGLWVGVVLGDVLARRGRGAAWPWIPRGPGPAWPRSARRSSPRPAGRGRRSRRTGPRVGLVPRAPPRSGVARGSAWFLAGPAVLGELLAARPPRSCWPGAARRPDGLSLAAAGLSRGCARRWALM
jgi:hypothetical protein